MESFQRTRISFEQVKNALLDDIKCQLELRHNRFSKKPHHIIGEFLYCPESRRFTLHLFQRCLVFDVDQKGPTIFYPDEPSDGWDMVQTFLQHGKIPQAFLFGIFFLSDKIWLFKNSVPSIHTPYHLKNK